jgi:alkylation response protein AidB-like acyl-CoA dehydrogenase
MLYGEATLSDLAPASWTLTDDQQRLCAAVTQFAHERLEPLLARTPDAAVWKETVRLAAALELGTMILPVDRGGMAVSRHDLALVIEQFAAGPLERATELTLSSAALMTLRAHDALDLLPDRDIRTYFDGTTSIALCIPEPDASCFWLLRQHSASRAITVRVADNDPRLILATVTANQYASQSVVVAALGALSLERCRAAPAVEMPLPVLPKGPQHHGIDPARTWLVEMAIYLGALLSGAMRHGVNFALDYSMSRHTFRKPLGSHQLVAARLADMLAAAHIVHLFVRSVAAKDASIPVATVRQMVRHVAAEAVDFSRELVQLCGGHGYVEGLPPAARFQTMHWFAMLLIKVDAALGALSTSARTGTPDGEQV